MRVFWSLQRAAAPLSGDVSPKAKPSFTRIASAWFRRIIEPPTIDHTAGIYCAERPPFFAAGRRDEI